MVMISRLLLKPSFRVNKQRMASYGIWARDFCVYTYEKGANENVFYIKGEASTYIEEWQSAKIIEKRFFSVVYKARDSFVRTTRVLERQ